ncbi:MAG TPA: flippase activity-associated protein Agl23 [Verrucomicrobiae bacterium]|jgi:uncharacterized protein (TIGR03663 family)
MDCSPSISAPSPKIRWAIFCFLALLALVIRLPHLGERPMHTDESINAYIIGQLLAGNAFHYDPQDRHGPALAAFTLPVVKLAGAKDFASLTESQLRLSPVLAGTATVLLFGAAVEMFGFVACFIAAVLFTLAPLTIYYHRYFIHESFFVLATFGLILFGWRALQRKSVALAALAGACAALMLAAKETAPLHFVALGLAALAVRFWSVRMRLRLGTAAARQDNGLLPAHPNLWKMTLAAFAVFLFVAVLLFTWFGQNWQVFHDLWQAAGNFTARAGGQGHEKPGWYYAKLLCDGWSGAAILILGLFGMVSVITQLLGRPKLQPLAPRIFLVVYALVIFAIYSAIPYKTPWLALNFWLPLALLAGITIECAWFATTKCLVRGVMLLFLIGLGYLLQHDIRLRVFARPADEKNPYAYAHTVEDMLEVPMRIDEIARLQNLPHPTISVVMADAWPLPWYLRKFSQAGFWQPGQEAGMADFYITGSDVPPSLLARLKNFRSDYYGVRPGVLLILWSPEAKPD